MNILGVVLSEYSRKEILEKIEDQLEKNESPKRGLALISTNSEMLVWAHKDASFRDILNKGDIIFPDGTGESFASFFLYGKWIERIPGSDFFIELLTLAVIKSLRVLFVIRKDGLSSREEIEKALEKKFGIRKNIFICWYRENDKSVKEEFQRIIQKEKPTMVFVGLGMRIQEPFIIHYRDIFPEVGIWMSVGGSFDFLSGKVRRAPKILRVLGFEWLWRLLLSPRKRLWRVFRAVIIFPLLVFFQKCGIVK